MFCDPKGFVRMNILDIKAGLLKNQDYTNDPCLVKLLSEIELKHKTVGYMTDKEINIAAKRLVCFGELNDEL